MRELGTFTRARKKEGFALLVAHKGRGPQGGQTFEECWEPRAPREVTLSEGGALARSPCNKVPKRNSGDEEAGSPGDRALRGTPQRGGPWRG